MGEPHHDSFLGRGLVDGDAGTLRAVRPISVGEATAKSVSGQSAVRVDGMAWYTRKSPCPIWTMLVC